jgi:hypothetical protein
MKERRKHERFELELPARLEMNSSHTTGMFELQTRNISSAGAFLNTARRFPVGTRCQLELIVISERIKELTGVHGLIKVEGTIVRSTPEGVAISFDGECQILCLQGSHPSFERGTLEDLKH